MAKSDQKRDQATGSAHDPRTEPLKREEEARESTDGLRSASSDDSEGESCVVVRHRDDKESDS